MTKYLLEKRHLNPNILGKDNWSALEIAVQSGLHEIAALLMQDSSLKLD